jgi:hypothetical protein
VLGPAAEKIPRSSPSNCRSRWPYDSIMLGKREGLHIVVGWWTGGAAVAAESALSSLTVSFPFYASYKTTILPERNRVPLLHCHALTIGGRLLPFKGC